MKNMSSYYIHAFNKINTNLGIRVIRLVLHRCHPNPFCSLLVFQCNNISTIHFVITILCDRVWVVKKKIKPI